MKMRDFPQKHPGINMELIFDIAEAIVTDLKRETNQKDLEAFYTFDDHTDSEIKAYVGKQTNEYVKYIFRNIENSVSSQVYNMLTDPKFRRYYDDLPNGWDWYGGKAVPIDEATDDDIARDEENRMRY